MLHPVAAFGPLPARRRSALLRQLRAHGPAAFVALLLLAVGLAVGARFAPREIVGDEPFYVQAAHRHTTLGARLEELVPGAMPFYWWPPLTPAVYALFAEAELAEAFAEGATPSPALEIRPLSPPLRRFVARIATLNACLLSAAGVLLYGLTRRLGAGRAAAVAAALAFGLSPRILYYVIGLWPDLLHVGVVTAALVCLTANAPMQGSGGSARTRPLAAGLLLGAASLIKPAAELYVLGLAALGVAALWRRPEGARALAPVLLLVAGFAAVNLPQRAANTVRHGSFAISANQWVNVEAGLLPEFTYATYFGGQAQRLAGEAYGPLEAASRRRVLDFLARAELGALLERSARQLFDVQLSQSFLARDVDLGRRWPVPPPGAAVRLGVWLSWLAFALGLPAVLLLGATRPGAWPVALYAGFQLALLAVGGFNPRFFVQAYPILCVAAAAGIDRAVRRLR